MWWGGSKPLDLYLGTRSSRLCDGERVLWQVQTEGAPQSLAAAQARLAQGQQPRRPRLRVWCSGGLCRPFILPAVAGVGSRVELEQIAIASAPAMTGLSGPCRVWLDYAASPAGTMSVAVEGAWLDDVRQQLGGCARIVSIRPWWTEALRVGLRAVPVPAVIGIQDCDSLVILAGAETGFDFATAMTPLSAPLQATQAWTRALFSANLEGQPCWRVRLKPEADAMPGLAGCTLEACVEVTT